MGPFAQGAGSLDPWQRWLTLERLRLYPTAVLGALLIALVLNIALSDGIIARDGSPLGGDFFGRYVVSRLILEGRGASVLSVEAQLEAHHRWSHGRVEGLYPIAYPPLYMFLLTPFAALPYALGYLAYIAAGATAVVVALRLLRPHSGLLQNDLWAPLVLALTFWPLVRGLTGGLFTPFTLLFLAGFYASWASGRRKRAGLWLGLLLLKPQLALPLAGLMLLKRQWPILITALWVLLVEYLISALIAGWAWPRDWLRLVLLVRDHDMALDFEPVASWVGVAETVLEGTASRVIGHTLSVLTLGLLALVWLRGPMTPAARPVLFGAAVSATLLSGFHVGWYDVGLALVPLLFLAERFRWQAAPYLLLLWPLAFLIEAAYAAFGIPPRALFFLLPLATFLLSLSALPREGLLPWPLPRLALKRS
jgi:alpha-1,2-mannosyltransferase